MKHREFVFIGDSAPIIDEKENAQFLLLFQKAILCSLEKRKLLTYEQKERCIKELAKAQPYAEYSDTDERSDSRAGKI